jgi:hypothetical protein
VKEWGGRRDCEFLSCENVRFYRNQENGRLWHSRRSPLTAKLATARPRAAIAAGHRSAAMVRAVQVDRFFSRQARIACVCYGNFQHTISE